MQNRSSSVPSWLPAFRFERDFQKRLYGFVVASFFSSPNAICVFAAYGFVVVGEKDIYFRHEQNIKQGREKAEIGAKVSFDIAPPRAGKRHPQAVNAVVGGAQ